MTLKRPHAIAAGHPETATAAAQILQQGGNAYDAILAAMMMSFVAEPLLASPGGGGFLLAAGPGQEPKLLDFFSDTPLLPVSQIDPEAVDFYPIMGDFGTRQQEFHIGRAAAAVPGVPAGIFTLHDKLCSMDLPDIAAPAIQAAQQGLVVNHQQAYVAMILKPIIEASAEARTLFSGLVSGQQWRNLQLAEFLTTLSSSTADWFYQGPVAATVCQQEQGLLTAADFAQYRCDIRQPLQLSINQHTLYTNPLPSSGGYLIVEQLRRLKSRHDELAVLEAMQHADDLKRHRMAEVCRGTTHISVADQDGNLASLTLSNGEGNGHVVGDYGFMMNNFLGEEDINPDGFFAWSEPQRLRSMMSPTVIMHPERQFAMGTGGSNRIKSALFQVINHLVHGGQILKHAIEAPRMHFENGHLDVEPGFAAPALKAMQKQCPIHTEWRNHNLYFGGVNAVQTGTTTAAVADFRRHGCGMVV
ncbi:gamma-glutamyltransferase [Marinicella meishanensis]|uniref:gamma-glutamyltransferase n=1 Tax=Marinicella meishanensis TaxID=2873263 RepID=UPI001CC01ABC|nr:gamma-glutamyltransferase [Marinicella sp. NBU2979]